MIFAISSALLRRSFVSDFGHSPTLGGNIKARRIVSSQCALLPSVFRLFIPSARHPSPIRLLATCCRWHYSGFLPPFRAPSPKTLQVISCRGRSWLGQSVAGRLFGRCPRLRTSPARVQYPLLSWVGLSVSCLSAVPITPSTD